MQQQGQQETKQDLYSTISFQLEPESTSILKLCENLFSTIEGLMKTIFQLEKDLDKKLNIEFADSDKNYFIERPQGLEQKVIEPMKQQFENYKKISLKNQEKFENWIKNGKIVTKKVIVESHYGKGNLNDQEDKNHKLFQGKSLNKDDSQSSKKSSPTNSTIQTNDQQVMLFYQLFIQQFLFDLVYLMISNLTGNSISEIVEEEQLEDIKEKLVILGMHATAYKMNEIFKN